MWGNRQESKNFRGVYSIYRKCIMLKEGLGSIYILALKDIKGKDNHCCLSFVFEQVSGQQRRTDVVTHTLFRF